MTDKTHTYTCTSRNTCYGIWACSAL